MKYYVKVTEQVAEKIIRSGVPLTMTSDGNCLLYQSELNDVDGVNLNERAANVGGSLIAESDALAEIKGTIDTPAYCYTPVEFGGEGDTRDNGNISSGGGGNPSSENTGNENTDTKGESEVSDE